MFSSSDVFAQLQPRHMGRRERRPGTRERHSAQRLRHVYDSALSATSNQKPLIRPARAVDKSTYSMNSAVTDFSRSRDKVRENAEEVIVTSTYKETSTIDAIRASMKRTAKPESAAAQHIPSWLLNLDINLDVSSVDIIPPYDSDQNQTVKGRETFNESPSLIFLETDSDSEENGNIIKTTNGPQTEGVEALMPKEPEKKRPQSSPPHSRQNQGTFSKAGNRPMSNTFRVAGGFSITGKENESPRRYQGDKKVMSMQQGGIRSTPFQPKAKKFINQMITYRHMKHHDMKIKKAKPAVDTKMPSTFKIALDRKQLVEHRLSDSWSRSSSPPTRRSQEDSSKTHSLTRSR